MYERPVVNSCIHIILATAFKHLSGELLLVVLIVFGFITEVQIFILPLSHTLAWKYVCIVCMSEF